MGTFIVKAKVLKTKEEHMELIQGKDLGNIQIERVWVYKRVGISASSIYKVIEYSASKTLLVDNDGEEMLVAEPFDEVYAKWQDNYEEDMELFDPEGGEVNQNGGNNSEDEED